MKYRQCKDNQGLWSGLDETQAMQKQSRLTVNTRWNTDISKNNQGLLSTLPRSRSLKCTMHVSDIDTLVHVCIFLHYKYTKANQLTMDELETLPNCLILVYSTRTESFTTSVSCVYTLIRHSTFFYLTKRQTSACNRQAADNANINQCLLPTLPAVTFCSTGGGDIAMYVSCVRLWHLLTYIFVF